MVEEEIQINKIFDSDFSEKYDIGLEEFILVFLRSFENDMIKGKTRFQKLIYLINKEHKIFNELNYYRYYYGPYSDALEDALRNLRINRLIDERTTYFDDTGLNFQIDLKLSEKGIQKAEEIKQKLGEKFGPLEKIIETTIKENNFHSMPLKKLLKIVYEKAGYSKRI
ncbi:MAG: hypothetical protein ACTSWR_10490 [Candidatus Helarchaeota archaeon]